MSSRLSASLLASIGGASVLLLGCGTPRNSSLLREDMVYIPPSTGTMVGRWVPRSQASDPTISPTSTASRGSISKLQNEGLKSTLSSPSVGLVAPRR